MTADHSFAVTRGNPSESEAAAIAAAIDQYVAELEADAKASTKIESGWQRAALREGVESRTVIADVWGSAPVGPG